MALVFFYAETEGIARTGSVYTPSIFFCKKYDRDNNVFYNFSNHTYYI